MCITNNTSDNSQKYDMNLPLEAQLHGGEEVIVNYEPNDPSINKFIGEIDRFSRNGICLDFDVKFIHNDHINGKRTQKVTGKLLNDININKVIELLVLNHSAADNKLEEIINFCKDKNCNV